MGSTTSSGTVNSRRGSRSPRGSVMCSGRRPTGTGRPPRRAAPGGLAHCSAHAHLWKNGRCYCCEYTANSALRSGPPVQPVCRRERSPEFPRECRGCRGKRCSARLSGRRRAAGGRRKRSHGSDFSKLRMVWNRPRRYWSPPGRRAQNGPRGGGMSNPVSTPTYRPLKASLRQLAQPLPRRTLGYAASGTGRPAYDCPRAWAADIQVGS
jgi:hypothetical protein